MGEKKDAEKSHFRDGTAGADPGPGRDLCIEFEADWENIFNEMTDMVTIHDADFNIVCANKAAEKALGLPMLNISRVKCFRYYHGKGCPPQGCPSCQCLKTGEPASFEIFEPHLGKFIEVRAIPRFDRERRVIGLIHIVRDITERKRAQEELEKHRSHLEELVQERTKELTDANARLQEALDNIKSLRGLIPICAWCKKVRDDKGYWMQVEEYVKKHSDADFTHGICQECYDKLKAGEEAKERKSAGPRKGAG
jgi:PAS domain-containing protein